MTTEQLQDRLEKAIERKNKKFITIDKKEKQIAKKRKLLADAGITGDKVPQEMIDSNYDLWNKTWDIEYLLDDIVRNKKEIIELDSLIDSYKQKLDGAREQEDVYAKFPEVLKRAEKELAQRWFENALNNIEKARELFRNKEYKKIIAQYGQDVYQFIRFATPEEEIKAEYEKSAKAYVMDLYRRVVKVTGEVIDYSGLRLSGHALNGVVTGKLGKVNVETIVAGGYNIQCEHLRAIIHEIK